MLDRACKTEEEGLLTLIGHDWDIGPGRQTLRRKIDNLSGSLAPPGPVPFSALP